MPCNDSSVQAVPCRFKVAELTVGSGYVCLVAEPLLDAYDVVRNLTIMDEA